MTRIGNLINKALVDGRVNKSEVEGLIKEAEKNGIVSANEKKELANLLKRHTDKFDAESAAHLASFLGEAAPKIVTPSKPAGPAPKVEVCDDPKVLNKHAGQITYNKIQGGQLFKDGVSFDDVVQGSIANCYFVGAISAVAYSDPKIIEDAITDHGDGTFTVRFYERGPSGRYEEKLVRVDDDFPSYGPGSSPRYAKSRDSKELWVSVLEKAYAALKGDYEAIGNGGYATEVMTALTGRNSSYYSLEYSSADRMFDLIKTGGELNPPMTAGTYGEDDGVDYKGTGVYAWHAYTLMGAVEENGVKYVQLRNPWGSSEPGSDGKNDGIFKMKIEDFMKLYQGINVN